MIRKIGMMVQSKKNTNEMSTYYRSIILAGSKRKGTGFAGKVNNGEELTWDDLNDATWAVMGPTSASGYIYPSLWLNENMERESVIWQMRWSLILIQPLLHVWLPDRLMMVSYGHIRTKYAPEWKETFGGTDDMVNQTGVIELRIRFTMI